MDIDCSLNIFPTALQRISQQDVNATSIDNHKLQASA
jgi:hypothetical protein